MEEKKILAKRTQDLQYLLDELARTSEERAMKTFDEIPIKEIREVCLGRIDLRWQPEIDWLLRRAKAYLEIKDFETVFMLLRSLSPLPYERGLDQQQILQLMIQAVRASKHSGYRYHYAKSALVILCGKIYHQPALYNEEVRSLFLEIIKEHYPGVYGSDEEASRFIMRVLSIIGHMKDKTFLPILKERGVDEKGLLHLMEYVSVAKERIHLEALRLLVIQHLENN